MVSRYKHTWVNGHDYSAIQAHLDECSAKGWELITSTQSGNGHSHHYYWEVDG